MLYSAFPKVVFPLSLGESASMMASRVSWSRILPTAGFGFFRYLFMRLLGPSGLLDRFSVGSSTLSGEEEATTTTDVLTAPLDFERLRVVVVVSFDGSNTDGSGGMMTPLFCAYATPTGVIVPGVGVSL